MQPPPSALVGPGATTWSDLEDMEGGVVPCMHHLRISTAHQVHLCLHQLWRLGIPVCLARTHL